MAGLRTTLVVLAASGGLAAGVASVGKSAPRPTPVAAANKSETVQQQPEAARPVLSPVAARGTSAAAKPIARVVTPASLILRSPAHRERIAGQATQPPLPTRVAPKPMPALPAPTPSRKPSDDRKPAEPTQDATTAPAPQPTTQTPAPVVLPSPTPVWSHDDSNDDSHTDGGGHDD